jgi:phage gp45-like
MQWEHEDAVRSATRRARIVEVDDSKSQQKLKIRGLKNEKPEEIWRTQDFGFSSVPPKDSDGIIDQMGSRSDRTTYRDAGHEKYRPKKTPEGGTNLFDHSGDIVRVWEDKLDVIHAKQLNIKIGKGYNAGTGDAPSGDTDDASSDSDEAISIVMTPDAVTITKGNSKIVLTASTILVEGGGDIAVGVPGRYVRVRPGRVDLGVTSPTGQADPQVVTTAGPSTKVFSVI